MFSHFWRSNFFRQQVRYPLSISSFERPFSNWGMDEMRMGLTGLEPVTLRLSSACSNQLSYRPGKKFSDLNHLAT
jgi:hypothetical protein